MYELRPYQRDAVSAVYEHLKSKDSNPCVVAATASGKSVMIAQIAKDASTLWCGRVMVLAHVKELVEQNAAKLKGICPELPVGIYSAGLDSRDVSQPVIVAGIQSVYNKVDAFKQPFDLIIVDEAHCIPNDGEGRYRTFLLAAKERNPNVRLIGFTATPYRTQGGLICKPENLLNEVCYEIGVKELINRGYISNITAKAGKFTPDTDGLHIRAGEFVSEDVEKLMGEDGLVNSACREIVELTKERKACLIFCTSVAHCKKVADAIKRFSGEECAIVTGDTPADEREETIKRLRGESVKADLFSDKPPLKYCCNVSVLTTGTDIPRLDTIALLRPTNSPGLLVQMVGRGFRLSPETGKTECVARGTKVLTDIGLVPIENVTTDMKVWDGVEFVSHDGAVCKGAREVISYAGITATPDHKVWTGNNWRTLEECARHNLGISVTGAGRYAIREADGYFRCRKKSQVPEWEDEALSSDQMRLRTCRLEKRRQHSEADGGMPQMRMPEKRTEMAGAEMHCGQAAMRECDRPPLLGLRGAGNNIRLQRSDGNGLLSDGAIHSESKVADRQNRQQQGIFSREHQIDYTFNQYDEQEKTSADKKDAVQDGASGDTLCGCDPGSILLQGHDGSGDHQEILQAVNKAQGEVWDILNAGPRHRFTANGLLVSNCLVLDYGRNIERHGPIDMIKVKEPGQGGGGPLAKVCPQCQAIVNLPVMLCPECGYQWPRKEPERKSHEATAAKVGILSGEVTVEKFPVQHTSYQVWEKRGAPPDAPKTVRVTYDIDYLTHYSEWLCPEHTGYARRKFEKWWREHAHPDCPMPRTAEEVCEHDFSGMLREVKEITVRFVSGQKYPEITGYELGDFPLVQAGQGAQGEEVSDEDWDDIPF